MEVGDTKKDVAYVTINIMGLRTQRVIRAKTEVLIIECRVPCVVGINLFVIDTAWFLAKLVENIGKTM